MFGHVPRLPVDVMFKQVSKDPVIVDYSSYVATLMSHLHKAAEIAQKHAVQEQRKQTKIYNRKLKGVHLNNGDRVLIANKGERGKRKLADRWESTVYTIVDNDPRTHIYKVKDDKGHTKVVHRNMLLDISFLPVTCPENETCGSTVADCSSDSDCESQSTNSTDSLEDEDPENRTHSLVLNEDVSRSSKSLDVQMETEEDVSDGTYCVNSIPDSQHQMLSDKTLRAGTSDCDIVSATVDFTNSGITDSDLPVRDDVSMSGPEQVQGTITTRAGRVVKKVNRLIETMAQKPFKMANLSDRFQKKSQSLLSLF